MTTHNRLILVLAGLSALGELFGTFTVWRSFRRTAKTAKEIRLDIERESGVTGTKEELIPTYADLQSTPLEVAAIKRDYAERIGSIASRLGPDPWTTAGLAGFVLGALFGFLTVAIAVNY